MSAEAAPETKAFQTNDPKATSDDPFAAQRGEGEDPFAKDKLGDVAGADDMAPPDDGAAAVEDDSKDFGRRMSREWDASKVPPSQFQKRKGSIYSTPSSRDGHVKGKGQYEAYFEKLKEKGWDKIAGKTK